MRISEKELESIQNKRSNAQKGTLQSDKSKSDARVLGRLKQGAMNKTERKYNDYLESKRMKGEILWFKFDCINLRLAEKTFYKPDFFVLTSDFELQVHEVKGHWEDDALVKIKVAAELYPFSFKSVHWNTKNNAWDVRHF
ncbi:hypothetical protein ACSRBF_11225 [Acinetobacter baumannii]|uniref:hypothetical protein n=1 Tax=Acinetobacter baumannii TaxID=470 RepID=UPI0010230677|nr:hypothetical protein [Acinetobacter baumannii]EII5854273.1 hypothetical protein [Acinetobacter baumannii]EJO3109639.1 hypothetical protein [Acinetobacter baumannii]EKU5069560.1 hypothetical protein [Acinetobacter baumannii]EKU5616735.1 hypothetical protein [Acinetobacter baumannii]EKV1962008.1 hypothetical protein [Acinetobacter baumannii]